MALIESRFRSRVDSWDFDGADWNDPDPYDIRYMVAIVKAVRERAAFCGSLITSYDWLGSIDDLGAVAVGVCPSVSVGDPLMPGFSTVVPSLASAAVAGMPRTFCAWFIRVMSRFVDKYADPVDPESAFLVVKPDAENAMTFQDHEFPYMLSMSRLANRFPDLHNCVIPGAELTDENRSVMSKWLKSARRVVQELHMLPGWRPVPDEYGYAAVTDHDTEYLESRDPAVLTSVIYNGNFSQYGASSGAVDGLYGSISEKLKGLPSPGTAVDPDVPGYRFDRVDDSDFICDKSEDDRIATPGDRIEMSVRTVASSYQRGVSPVTYDNSVSITGIFDRIIQNLSPARDAPIEIVAYEFSYFDVRETTHGPSEVPASYYRYDGSWLPIEGRECEIVGPERIPLDSVGSFADPVFPKGAELYVAPLHSIAYTLWEGDDAYTYHGGECGCYAYVYFLTDVKNAFKFP